MHIIAPAPIHTLLPILTSLTYKDLLSLKFGFIGWFVVIIVTFGPIKTLSPIYIFPSSTRERLKGAYVYDKKIKGVVNKSGYTLSLETYGVNWVAYDRKIIEEPPQKII